jgi:tetratricopeptide (TPR) repeat protein
MEKSLVRATGVVSLLAVLGLAGCARAAGDQPRKPLRAATVVALVAGNALPENIVYEIKNDGLAFRPDDTYRSLLKAAGADNTVIAALNTANVTTGQAPETESGADLLQHLAKAGADLKAKQYDEAGNETMAALKVSFDRPACGFVMGEVLRQKRLWSQAAAVYEQVLDKDPSFPEVHTKLSFILDRQDDSDRALQEAQAALAHNPNDAEAHKNAGLALCDMQRWAAAAAEYDNALRIKPVYPAVELDLGILYMSQSQWDKALAAYQKGIVLNGGAGAEDAYNMGYIYDRKNDRDSAIREYREAIRLDPKWFDPRENLGGDLLQTKHYAEAVKDFREMEQLFPGSNMCHRCLGLALFETWDLSGAEQEYKLAIQLDPKDAYAHYGFGSVRETQKRLDEALAEYRKAEELEPTLSDGWIGAGRVLIAQKKYAEAAAELKQGESNRPDSPEMHQFYAEALEGTGNLDAAIAEFKSSLQLEPKNIQVQLKLAAAYEKKGDWVESFSEYRQAALVDSGIDPRKHVTRSDQLDPQKEYAAAQRRWNQHIAALKAAGKSSEASTLEARLRTARAAPGLSEQLDAALRAGVVADKAHKFDEAIVDYKHAVELAEKIQPTDPRLVMALEELGNQYFGWNVPAAQAAYEREYQVALKLSGPNSPNLEKPLQALGRSALKQKDYASAQKFLFRAVDIDEKTFGEGSRNVANSLWVASNVFIAQKQWDKAESYLQRSVHIIESLDGPNSIDLGGPLFTLSYVYDDWGKHDRADACDKQLVAILQKQYGSNSPFLVQILDHESKQLRDLGRVADANVVDQRIASIRAASMKPN